MKNLEEIEGRINHNKENRINDKEGISAPNQIYLLRREVGARLKEIRRESGLSHGAFARSLRVSKSALNRYVSGKNEPKVSIVRLLQENFKVNPNWFITGFGPPYLKGVEEEGIPYDILRKEDPALKEVVERLTRHPEMVQILHKLFQVDPSQKEALKAYLMALEISLRVQENK